MTDQLQREARWVGVLARIARLEEDTEARQIARAVLRQNAIEWDDQVLTMRTAPPFDKCPTCDLPQIADSHSLVLYFPSDRDCRGAAASLKAALPQTFTAFTTDGEIDG